MRILDLRLSICVFGPICVFGVLTVTFFYKLILYLLYGSVFLNSKWVTLRVSPASLAYCFPRFS